MKKSHHVLHCLHFLDISLLGKHRAILVFTFDCTSSQILEWLLSDCLRCQEKSIKWDREAQQLRWKCLLPIFRCSAMYSLEYQLCNPLLTRGEIPHDAILSQYFTCNYSQLWEYNHATRRQPVKLSSLKLCSLTKTHPDRSATFIN